MNYTLPRFLDLEVDPFDPWNVTLTILEGFYEEKNSYANQLFNFSIQGEVTLPSR
jgi:hypothetical protein